MSSAWPLLDEGRLQALVDLGLTEASDAGMERYARRVRDQLGVPVSLVSLVQADQQVFPGMCGLPDPWASRRATPLSHSFCQHVVDSGEPLVIEDARLDELVRENLATTEIGVVAYAGMPLTDDDGHVLGSLCAIDTRPRRWTNDELETLRDVAVDCSNELRLRLARLDARQERERRDAIDEQLRLAVERSVRLASIAESLNSCRTIADVRRELAGFVDASTGLVDADLHLLSDRPRVHVPTVPPAGPSGIVVVQDLLTDSAGLAPSRVDLLLARGVRSVGYLPVRGSADDLAVIELLWDVPRQLDPEEHAMASALASYSAQAIERALLLEDRISVAHELQAAMLSSVPTTTDLEIATCYVPASAEDQVGGDWHDALVLPAGPGARPLESDHRPVLLTVGDVTGHDIAAAALMGQVRAMLRQAAADHADAAPSELLSRLEQSCSAFGLAATGTAVVARLDPCPGTSRWQLTWTNAGHPPLLLLRPDGTPQLLHDHDMIFGHPELLQGPRRDHTIDLEPGSLLVIHTDGVTDSAAVDPDEQSALLVDLVVDHRGSGAQGVVDAIAARFGSRHDDVVAVALRVP